MPVFFCVTEQGQLACLGEQAGEAQAEAILASCDDEPVALLGPAEMRLWAAELERGLRTPS